MDDEELSGKELAQGLGIIVILLAILGFTVHKLYSIQHDALFAEITPSQYQNVFIIKEQFPAISDAIVSAMEDGKIINKEYGTIITLANEERKRTEAEQVERIKQKLKENQ